MLIGCVFAVILTTTMTTKSKGVRERQKERIKEIIGLRQIGLSWKKIGIIVDMDRNNARRTYLKEQKNGIR